MPGASGVRLEPELVGDQHKAIVGALLGRFQIDPATGRWALRPDGGGLVVLSGPSGVGKSRIVREVYRGLRAKQSRPGYWPELAPTGGAGVAEASESGLAIFGFRKSVGPDSAGFVWPADAVPDYLWWQVGCQAASSGGFLDAQALFANELLRHQEPARFGWARAVGGKRWLQMAKRLLPHAGLAVVDEGKSEAVAALLAEAAGQAVPFGGLVTRSVQALTGAAIRASDRQARLGADTGIGAATGGREDPTGTLAAVVASLALPGFPVVIAVEDLHDADEATLELVARLTGSGFSDRVLVIATGWPEALPSRMVGDVSLTDWLRTAGGEVVPVAALDDDAVAELVLGQFPDTAPDRVMAIAQRWSNPLAVALVLDLLAGEGAVDGDAINADDASISEAPSDLSGLYDQQFARLSVAARRAVILDVICGADAATAEDFGGSPGPASTWNPVDPGRVLEAASRQGLESSEFDHHAALGSGWLMVEQDWVTPREPGLGRAAWRAMRGHRLRGAAPKVRSEAARLLAEVISDAARNSDGTPGLFIHDDRWWLRESAWMLSLAPSVPDEPKVQASAARAALELFRHQAQMRPQEAVRDWAAWAPSWEAVLGTEHPDTLTARNLLAYIYQSAGQLGRAIQLFEGASAEASRVLGADHQSALTARGFLASAYREAGELARAIPLLEEVLADMERVLGMHHETTSSCRNSLAMAYQTADQLDRAIPLYELALADSELKMGVDHPGTLVLQVNTAFAYAASGDGERAVPLLETTLVDMQRVMGPDHPDTLRCRGNLAAAYVITGDVERAVSWLERTLVDMQRVMGADHPNTLRCRTNLAGAYLLAGDLSGAIALLEKSLLDMKRVLGEDHPDTLMTGVDLLAAQMAARFSRPI